MGAAVALYVESCRQTGAEFDARLAEQPNMGLTTWKGNIVRKGDIITAKKLSG